MENWSLKTQKKSQNPQSSTKFEEIHTRKLSQISLFYTVISSPIRQKGESQNGLLQENKACQIFRICTHVGVSGGKKCSFSGKFGVLCFPVIPAFRFAFLPYCHRIMVLRENTTEYMDTSCLIVSWEKQRCVFSQIFHLHGDFNLQ